MNTSNRTPDHQEPLSRVQKRATWRSPDGANGSESSCFLRHCEEAQTAASWTHWPGVKSDPGGVATTGVLSDVGDNRQQVCPSQAASEENTVEVKGEGFPEE